jgi:solute carrier family 25 (mitochondrial phosphate transporter), member 23/24/25/41
LLTLFHSIDRDNNGNLDKSELKSALEGAGLVIPQWKIDQFFEEVDVNHDGVISFEEWR